jgi:hypothetical protein
MTDPGPASFDRGGGLLVVDDRHIIRRLSPEGTIETATRSDIDVSDAVRLTTPAAVRVTIWKGSRAVATAEAPAGALTPVVCRVSQDRGIPDVRRRRSIWSSVRP